MILLVMQARDNSVRVTWNGRRLHSGPGHGEPAPSWLPEANEAARLAAEVMGGLPGSGLNEVLLNRPFTAHILGGAAIGAGADDGVVDGGGPTPRALRWLGDAARHPGAFLRAHWVRR